MLLLNSQKAKTLAIIGLVTMIMYSDIGTSEKSISKLTMCIKTIFFLLLLLHYCYSTVVVVVVVVMTFLFSIHG